MNKFHSEECTGKNNKGLALKSWQTFWSGVSTSIQALLIEYFMKKTNKK